jgi:hypothetical protein
LPIITKESGKPEGKAQKYFLNKIETKGDN